MATKEQREAELARIYKRDGSIRPSVVVREAKLKKNPLHNEFEWDDAKAASEHRLATARRIIRVTEIRLEPSKPKQRLVHVPSVTIEGPTAATNQREGDYKPVDVVVQNDDELGRALNALAAQIRAVDRTISQIKKAAGKKSTPLISTLVDSLHVARDTVQLMLKSAA